MLWKWSKRERENIRKQFLDMLDNASNNLYNGNRGRNFEDVNYDKTSEEKGLKRCRLFRILRA